MMTTLVYEEGQFRNGIAPRDISGIVSRPEALVWLDVVDPSDADFALLQEEFGFHPLSIEDAREAQENPKIDIAYPQYYFIAAHALRYDAKKVELVFHELDVFVGANYLVTVHRGPIACLGDSLRRAETNPELMKEGVGTLLYHVMDAVIDEYTEVLETFNVQVDEIEEGIFLHEFRAEIIQDIFRLRREMLELRRMASRSREVFNTLMRRDRPIFTIEHIRYFQDIYDHLSRIIDTADIHREVLTGALEAYLSVNANNLNVIMKTFAGISIILMTGSLIAGIYGMNFKMMPELDKAWGYPYALLLMVLLGVLELWWFRRKKWL